MATAEPDAIVAPTWGASGDLGTIVVVPDGDRNAPLGLRVVMGVSRPVDQCDLKKPDGCIVATRRLRFLEHRTVELPVGLHAICEGVACAESETCNALGECVLAEIDPTDCDGPDDPDCLPPGDILPGGVDAGPTDAGDAGDAADADANDASDADADARDAEDADASDAEDAGDADAGLVCDLYVNDDTTTGDVFTSALGDDANPGTADAPFATPGFAVSQASSGAVICVDTGTYPDNLTVDRSVVLLGARRGETACGRTGPESVIQGFVSVEATADSVTLDGLMLNQEGVQLVFAAPTFRLLNTRVAPIEAPGGYQAPGFLASKATSSGTFDRIEFEGNEVVGIYNVEGVSGIFLAHSPVTGPLRIVRNCFLNTGPGAMIVFGTLQRVDIDANLVVNAGGAESGGGIGIGATVEELNVTNNTVTDSGRNGLILDQCAIGSGRITGNVFRGNGASGPGFANFRINSGTVFPPGFVLADNDFSAPATGSVAITSEASGTISAECNWFGSVDPGQVAAQVSGNVDVTPFLTDGTDSDPATPGFQPVGGSCTGGQ